MRIVTGSTALIGPSADSTRLPTRRKLGSSSSSTTTTGYGANSAYAGRSGGCATTNDHTRPRPDALVQVTAIERHAGHIGRGGRRILPQSAQVWISSSPRVAPS